MRLSLAVLVAASLPLGASGQPLARRVAQARDGVVSFTFASRPGVCGNGRNLLRDGFDDGYVISENVQGYTRGRRWEDECERGPVRVVASVVGGEVVHLRTYAGPVVRESDQVTALGDVDVRDATSFLKDLAESGSGRVADQALLPLVLADDTPPWPLFLRLARSDTRPKSLRRNASTWLARAAGVKLGLSDREETDDDKVRESAVFALSQQRENAVPQLLTVARTSPHPAARVQALFWLGQTADPRAIDYFAEILGLR
jgi:hypothetical protein